MPGASTRSRSVLSLPSPRRHSRPLRSNPLISPFLILAERARFLTFLSRNCPSLSLPKHVQCRKRVGALLLLPSPIHSPSAPPWAAFIPQDSGVGEGPAAPLHRPSWREKTTASARPPPVLEKGPRLRQQAGQSA